MKRRTLKPAPLTREDFFTGCALIGLLAALPHMREDTFAAMKGRPTEESLCLLARVFGRHQANKCSVRKSKGRNS